ncbi:MAG: hypothetical protein WKG00_08550 [Polyangiaceae bacterium]
MADAEPRPEGAQAAGGSTGTGSGSEHCDQIDIVFVIESSPPMMPEQQLLAANFPAFFETIDNFTTLDGDPIQYRIPVTSTGVTTTNTGGFICEAVTQRDDGRFRQAATMPNSSGCVADDELRGAAPCLSPGAGRGTQTFLTLPACPLYFARQCG